MSYNQDGNFNASAQDGAKQISLPFQDQGNFYAKVYTRRYKAVATAYYPIRGYSATATNLRTYAEEFDNAVWTKDGTTCGANETTTPWGNFTADKLKENTANSYHIFYSDLTLSASTAYSYSFVVSASERTRVQVYVQGLSTSPSAYANFNLSSATVTAGGNAGAGTGYSASIRDIGGGWFRISLTTVLSTDTSIRLHIGSITSDNQAALASHVGVSGYGFYLFAAQVNAGTTPDAYISTTSATRAATVPAVDVDDPIAFLVDETSPDQSALLLGMAEWTRFYANVPEPIVKYATISINKPSFTSLGGTAAGTIYATTALTTNLGSVQYLAPNLFGNNKIFSRTLPLSTSANSGANTRVSFGSAHGLAGTETILPVNNSSVYWVAFTPSGYTVVSATIVDLLAVNWGTSVTEVAKQIRSYTPGPDRVLAKLTTSFYLPGFTVGIATAADIPIPSPIIDDAAFVAAAVATTSGYLTYDANPLGYWRAPIYQQEIIQINMADL